VQGLANHVLNTNYLGAHVVHESVAPLVHRKEVTLFARSETLMGSGGLYDLVT